jgi:DNA-binding IclR family transcriptional regulator
LGGAYLRSFDQVREFYRLTGSSEGLSGELVNLAILDGVDAIYIARHEGAAPLRLSAGVGDRLPAALTAVGAALLGSLAPEDVARRFKGYRWPRLTERSTTSLAGLKRKLAADRGRGYALDQGESTPGVIGIGLPVPPARPGAQAWGLGVSLIVGPGAEDDLPEARIEALVAAMRAVASCLANPMMISSPAE